MLGAEMNGERGGVLVDETAHPAGHLLASEVGLEVRLHVVLPRHLLAAQQAHKLGLAVRSQHSLSAALKGGNPWNSGKKGWKDSEINSDHSFWVNFLNGD